MKPRRVIFITDWAYPIKGGTERVVFGISEYMAGHGIEMHIVTPSWDNEKSEEVINGVHIHRFKLRNLMNPYKRMYGFYKAGFQVANKKKVDIVHSIYTLPLYIAGYTLSKTLGAKYIFTWQEREPLEEHFTNFMKKSAILRFLKTFKADYMTTVSWELEKYLKKHYFGNTKELIAIPNWVEDKFKPSKSKSRQREKIILFVGRLNKQKGAFILLEAFAKIKDKTDANLVFVGPPYEKKEAVVLIKKLGIASRTKIVGFVSEKELINWYNRCYIVSVPTIYKGAFGLTLVEAMACGKPVVGTDDLGLPDAIGNGGLIARAGDVDSLARCLERILTDKKLYRILKRNAIDRVNKMFRKEIAMKKYLQLYETAVS